jgi:DNA repair exonuclease SbcCD ATPase subunit
MIGGLVVRVVIAAISAAVSAAVLFAADWLSEGDIRRRQGNIRETKLRLRKAQTEISEIGCDLSLERGRREYLRRQALISYRKAQRDLLLIGRDALNDAKTAAFTKLRVVQDRIRTRTPPPRTSIDGKLLARFQSLKKQVHEAIADSKALTTLLDKRLLAVKRELDALHDSSTHGRLGGKKKVRELLAQLRADGRSLLASRDARGSTLRLGDRAYVLEQLCGGCRVWLSPAMGYCPSCGAAHDEVAQQRHLMRNAGDDIFCPECFAPTTPEFQYCFNCGERQDPFGLKSAL